MADTCFWHDEVAAIESCSEIDDLMFTETGELLSITTPGGGRFGEYVAITDGAAVVADPGNEVVYTYYYDDGDWVLDESLTITDSGNAFGEAVACSGNYVAVGAYDAATADPYYSVGEVYIFYWSGGWAEQDVLSPPSPAGGERFGAAVGLSGDYLAVGAWGNSQDASAAGRAYIYLRSGSSWNLQDTLIASDAAYNQYFGRDIDIFGDDCIVGAEGHSSLGANTGAVYVFTRSGSVWSEQQKIIASDASSGGRFGTEVCIRGNYAIVASDYGAYIYHRSGGVWTEQWGFSPDIALNQQELGGRVALSDDGVFAAIYGVADPWAANVYVYRRTGSTWAYFQTLAATNPGDLFQFGGSIRMAGEEIIVGSWRDTDGGGTATGGANIFARVEAES